MAVIVSPVASGTVYVNGVRAVHLRDEQGRLFSLAHLVTAPLKGHTMPENPMEESPAREAGAPPAPAEPSSGRWVKVWDLPTRLFHWGLVFLVIVGVVTGFVTPEWWMGVHVWAGYGLVALMVFRLVWGLCGPEYSRVVSFLYPPRDTVEHLRGLLLLRPPHYVGHNPTGALMVFALTGVLIALVATGLLVLGGRRSKGHCRRSSAIR